MSSTCDLITWPNVYTIFIEKFDLTFHEIHLIILLYQRLIKSSKVIICVNNICEKIDLMFQKIYILISFLNDPIQKRLNSDGCTSAQPLYTNFFNITKPWIGQIFFFFYYKNRYWRMIGTLYNKNHLLLNVI